MTVEDGATLGECLAKAKDASDIPRPVRVCETIRKPRTKALTEYGAENARIWQLPDGEEQIIRDERMKSRPLFTAPTWDGRHVDEVVENSQDPLFFP
jgi:hypothetical protein